MPTPNWMNVPDPGPEPPRPDEFEVGVDPTGMVRRRIQRDHDEWLRNQRLFVLSKISQELVDDDIPPEEVVRNLRTATLLLIELEIERKAPASSLFGF